MIRIKSPLLIVLLALGVSHAAMVPTPYDGALGMPLEGDTLRWTGSSAASYNIYMSTNEAEVKNASGKDSKAFLGNTEKAHIYTGTLKLATQYFWRVDIVSSSGEVTKGSTWKAMSTKSNIVTRLNGGNPIIHEKTPGALVNEKLNINGPSMIRIPDWIKPEDRAHPDAVYYLYFAHHSGKYIKMAWAKDIEGPYTVYKPGRGVANFDDTAPIMKGHVASPDVHVDHINKRIFMYVHGDTDKRFRYGQNTIVLLSPSGLNFKFPKESGNIACFYMKTFDYKGNIYGIANFGWVFRARTPSDPWNMDADGDGKPDSRITGSNPEYLWHESPNKLIAEKGKSWRHNAVKVIGDTLHIWYTTRNAKPERVRHTTIDLAKYPDEKDWQIGPVTDVLEPEMEWEGAKKKLTVSKNSDGINKRELRDPAVFTDIDGKMYLLYSGEGEEAIGLAIFNHTKDNNFNAEPTSLNKPVYQGPTNVVLNSGSWTLQVSEGKFFSATLTNIRGEVIHQITGSGGLEPPIHAPAGVSILKVAVEGQPIQSFRLYSNK